MIIVETDEDAHGTYNLSCEWKHPNAGSRHLQTEGIDQVCFVRFNPSKQTVGGTTKRCSLNNRLEKQAKFTPLQAREEEEMFTLFKFYYHARQPEPVRRVPAEEIEAWFARLQK